MKRLPIILFVLLLFPFAATAQDRIEACATDRNVPPAGPYYWPPDSEVKIYLVRDMFTPDQRRTIFEAMEAWTRAAQSMGAGVKFTLAGESEGTVNCQGCLSIKRREVHKYDRGHYAYFFPLKFNQDGSLSSAWIDLDFATTDPHAVKGFAAHEIGHGLGLWDCTTCKRKQTIMNAFPGINRDNGLVGPSGCDLEAVKRVYSTLRAEASQKGQTAASRKAKAGDQPQ
jgi:hypothetical protein